MPVPNRVARTTQTSPGSGDGEAASSSVKSARRVLDILELLGANVEGLKFPQIAELLGLPKSSLHALLATLHAKKWIAFDEASRTYRIGVRAWEVGQGYLRARDLALIADEHRRAARAELNETIQLGVLDGVEVLYIAKVDADRPFRLVSRAGLRLPAWATGLGKVLLAYLPPAELRRRMEGVQFVPFTENTITDIAQLERVLARIRAEGIGRDQGEHTAFVYCVAAPVRDKTGAVVAAMSCSLPEPPQRGRGDRHLAEVISRHAAGLSASLGWEDPGQEAR
jgi:IclR family transcriptional regulator, KDG regulon repressor